MILVKLRLARKITCFAVRISCLVRKTLLLQIGKARKMALEPPCPSPLDFFYGYSNTLFLLNRDCLDRFVTCSWMQSWKRSFIQYKGMNEEGEA